MNNILIISYPKSGATFTRYIIEYLTGLPSMGPPYSRACIDAPLLYGQSLWASFNKEQSQLSKLPYKSCIIKMHAENQKSISTIQEILKEDTTLILLLRNPIEVFTRQPSPGIMCYQAGVEIFKNFIGNKKIVFYEDLTEDPSLYVGHLCEILNLSKDKRINFMKDYEKHFSKVREFYSTCYGSQEMKTTGKIATFYSKDFSIDEQIAKWNSFLQTIPIEYKKLFERYYRHLNIR
jgi:hypothetical protein